MHAWRVRGCTPRSMHAACVDASRQSTTRSTRTSSTFLLASSYPPTPSYILAWGQHVTTPLPFSKRRARRLASGQKESCINSKGKRLESAEKRSRTTAVSNYGHRLLLRSPRPSQGMISSQGTILAPTNERNLEHRLGRQTHENRLSPSQARTHESLVYYKVHETVVQENPNPIQSNRSTQRNLIDYSVPRLLESVLGAPLYTQF